MVSFDPTQLAVWCNGVWHQAPHAAITGIVHDSRSAQPGQLYVALRGERLDGHQFLDEVFKRGAAAALVDQAFAKKNKTYPHPLLVVPDTRQALMQLAASHRARCGGVFIGITGSVGKTSVKEMTADVLARQGVVTRTWSNWNNDIGLPLSMLRMDPSDRFGVFEIGMNHPGELEPLCDLLKPTWGIITPIGPVHVEHFGDVEGIVREKSNLLTHLPETGVAILSVDDEWYPTLLTYVRSKVIRVSMSDLEADYVGTLEPSSDTPFLVYERRTGETHAYTLSLPGRYVADNALRAIAAGRELGVPVADVQTAIASYRPLSMRWNEVEVDGIHFINDAYNANPISMRAALEALQESGAPGRKWVVLAGMFELGQHERDEHETLGRFLAQFPWAGVVVIGRLGALIADGARAAGWPSSIPLCVCVNTDDAAAYLKDQLMSGDQVLIKASRGEKLEQVLDAFQSNLI